MSASSGVGRRLRGLGRLHVAGRVAPQLAFAQQVTEQAAAGRKPALDAARRQAATVLARSEHAHVLRIDLLPVA